MKKNEICQKLRPLMRKVVVIDGNVVTSAGSGIVVKDDGTILTARHVIVDEKGRTYTGHILVSGLNTGSQQYYPTVTPDFSFDMNIPNLMSRINLDICILKPVQPQENIDYIPIANEFKDIGDDIIMAGFPEDITEPLHFFQKLNVNNPDIGKLLLEYEAKYKFLFRQLMFKHGIVGNRQTVVFNKVHLEKLTGWTGPKTIKIKGAIYWTDNHLTYGGSGGPLVNDDCELIGIMTEKAFTKLKLDEPSDVKIPSGTGMALSPEFISWMLSYI